MANNLNRCEFIGNLGNDPEMKAMPSGDSVTNISLACNWKSKNAEGTEWVRVVAFGKLAEIMGQCLSKGSKVFIAGKMRTRKWTDQSGTERYSTEIVANEMEMLSPNTGQTANPAPARNAQAEGASAGGGDFSDDIPFNQISWRLA